MTINHRINPNKSCELRLPVISYNLHDLATAQHIGGLGVTANSPRIKKGDIGFTVRRGLHDSVA